MDIQNYQPTKVIFTRAKALVEITLDGLINLDIQLLTRHTIVYVDHIKIADVLASPSYICKLANYTSFLAMLSNKY